MHAGSAPGLTCTRLAEAAAAVEQLPGSMPRSKALWPVLLLRGRYVIHKAYGS